MQEVEKKNPVEYECKLNVRSAFLRTFFSFPGCRCVDELKGKTGGQKQHTGDSMSSSNWTEQRSHFSSVWARCMIFLTIFSRSVCSSNRSLTTSRSAWTQAEDDTTVDMTSHHLATTIYLSAGLFFCIGTKKKKYIHYLYPPTFNHW